MVTQIDNLPIELLEFVLQHLDFADICHLRLVCKQLSIAANLGLVKSDFGTKEVALHDLEQLRTLKDQVSRGWKSCRLTGLTVFGLISATTTDIFQDVDDHVRPDSHTFWTGLLDDDTKDDEGRRARKPPGGAQALLAELFTAICLNGRDGLLDLRLDVRGRLLNGEIVSSNRIYHWKWNLEVAAQLYKIAINALATSRLAVKRLNVFGDTLRCSLAADGVTMIEACRLESLTHISVCLSIPLFDIAGPLAESNSAFYLQKFSIASLIARSPSLESLDIRLYYLPIFTAIRTPRDWFHEFLSSALREPTGNLQNLQHLSLQGIHMDAVQLDELSTLLPTLRTLRLEAVDLDSLVGTTDTKFNLPDPVRFPLLERFEAHGISIRGKKVVFSATDSPAFPDDAESWREGRTPFDMVWTPGSSSGLIECTPVYREPIHSPHWLPYRRVRSGLFGPPNANFGQSTWRRQFWM